MQDGALYSVLLSEITRPRQGSPTFASDELNHRHFPAGLLAVDDSLRAAEIVRRLKQLKCPPVVRVEDICNVRG